VDQVAGVESDAEKIGGNESELRGLDANDTNDRAVNGSNHPALPELFANEHRRRTVKMQENNRVESCGAYSAYWADEPEAKPDGILSWRTYVYGSPSIR